MGPSAAHSIKDQLTLENLDFGDGPEHNQHSFRVNGKYGTYIVNLTSEQCSRYASTEEGKQYAEKADALRKRISNLQKSAYNFKPLNAAIDELAELETTGITNAQWRRENMGNMNLTVLEESLLQADDYLYGHRGFRVPGYTVNIYLSDVANPSAFAYTVKLEHQPKPFVLDYTKRADFDKEPGQLLLTLTHELFHVAQTEYNPLNEDKDLPFSEATAGLVEMEASEYYEKHHISSVSRSMALDPFDSGSLPYMQYSPFEPIQRYKEGDSDDETNYREHGYAPSGLLAKIRDSLNRGDDFCKQLMERAAAPDSSGEWNPYLNIVLDTMGGDRAQSAASLTDLYDAYLLEHRDSMLTVISRNTSSSPYDLSADSNSPYTARIVLSEDHPFQQLAMPAEPLSFRALGLRINESDPERQYRFVLLHGTDPYEEKPGDPADNQKLIISDKPTHILQSFDQPGYAIFEKNASDMFYVSESNSYTTDEKTHPNTYEVLLLLEPKSHEYDYHFLPESPEDGEGAQEKEREFVIELFDTSEHYGYTVNFYTKNKHGNTYTQVKHREEFDAAPGAAEFRFSVEELEKLLGVKDLEDIQFSLCRRMDPLPEDAKSPDASADGAAVRPSEPVYGPECSPVILHTELEELLGHYSGQTFFRQALVTRECYERYRQQNPEDPLTKQQCDALMTSSLTENQRMNINDFCIAATREELQQNTCRVQCWIVLTSDGDDGEKEIAKHMLETKAYFDGKRLLLNGETSDGREKTFQIRVHNHRDGRQTLSSLEFPAFLRLDEGKGTVIEAFLMFSALVRKNP